MLHKHGEMMTRGKEARGKDRKADLPGPERKIALG